MLINEIVKEAKFSKQKIYGYHGTHIKNLRSIIKKGLVQQHDEGFGSGIRGPLYYSLDPLGGIYFTNEYKEAKSISAEIIPRNKPPLVIVAQINPKSIIADDDYLERFLTLFPEIGNEYDHIKLRKNIKNVDEEKKEQKINRFVNKHHKTTLEELDSMLQKSNIAEQTKEHLISRLKPILLEYINILTRNAIQKHPKDITSTVNSMRDTVRKLIKHIHQKVLTGQAHDARDVRFSVNQDRMTFSGTNKIIGIILPDHNLYWGDIGIAPEGMQQVSTPTELLARINEHQKDNKAT